MAGSDRTGDSYAPPAPGEDSGAPPAPAEQQPGITGAPPRQEEDLLGLRIGAALIDLGLLAGLLVILSLAIGGVTVESGRLTVGVSSVWLLAYLAVVFFYYFALEAATGQTPGKRLLGLQVVLRADGTRPSGEQIAARTIFRIVDWLPLMYLVGIVAMLVTGARRQRLGDLVGGTGVVRQVPARRRGPAFVAVGLVLVAIVGLSVYRAADSERTATYQAHGVLFRYPAGWHVGKVGIAASAGAQPLWTTGVGPDPLDVVVVEAFRLSRPITVANIDAVAPDVARLARNLFRQLGGRLQAGPEKTTVAGEPGLRFQGTGLVNGSATDSTVVFVFVGTTEYSVNCQHTPENAAEIDAGCDQILRTLSVPTKDTSYALMPAGHGPGGQPPGPRVR